MTVTHPAGFRAAGVAAGLKSSGDPDVALVVNDGPHDAAAAVFTTNRFPAAPVLWSRQVLAEGRARAVVLNSGGANACTGPDGFADTHATAEHVAEQLGIGAIDVAVASTGLIGIRLPMDRLTAGVTAAAATLSTEGGADAARAIMTTDSVPKTTVQARDGWSIGGMAKGAGMLAPSLATMLVVLTTDAVVPAELLGPALRTATALSVERVDSDGCLSTNDTVVVLSSGASGVTPTPEEFAEALQAASLDLAMQLLADAEGSTKDIAITVRNAATVADALTAGRACARNNLLKTALFGNDPNWGRVLAAIGTTDAAFEADRVDVTINGVTVCRGGAIGDDRDGVDLTGRAVTIDVDLAAGSEQATIWTNDLSIAYVHENSAYST
ncbi:bifunctional glutamate N-acetyltransferase/amino-acid acetyltransferase ArgJ [Modestobacter sp. I12A-02628]|uniref:Arginine biosynthesis bifunctional protein ArgJ n=1 Tax=Goekera deserti TaxID=2497753 RepID=A0A7K3WJG4_9ACTN|nr:bifunctional glutamate N-acetyltransferase/amino-acid acetyltransferase ArgJ [Goekera deserti]MPQ98986.1 bifunctional glutamate N-acetyltransferase/amino-acid acetyltransferase ArgJ [Goekera deserti]NDI47320.1 bifunctional glutamate N-acetyltransferase/amino-acid acetyltransferase ArgJ [Goekera deserti]NEL55850.1 bifunctional glutamate N-acetyltransferase/amino-acid acetyltransferase ArgJ [Goekera deserti]